MKYVMLLQVKETENSKTECKAIRLPECDDKDTTYLYKVLFHFSYNKWVNQCGVIPGLDCGCLPEDDKKFWESHLVDYADVITE